MYSLVYYSQATHPFGKDELFQLAEQASYKNHSLSITGFLQYKENHFFQYLEGNKDNVLALMDPITQDPRHIIVRMVHLPDIENRQFNHWYMRYLTQQDFTRLALVDVLEEVLVSTSTSGCEANLVKKRIMRLIARVAEYHQSQDYLF